MGEKQNQSIFKRVFIQLIKMMIKLAIWVVMFTVIIMPIIYLYGSQKIHDVDTHPLYDVFYTDPYVKLMKMIDRNQHVLLYGTQETGIQHFLIHYANQKTKSGSQVVMRPLTSDDDMQLQSILTQIRHFYEDNLNIVEEEPTIWILLTEDNQIPQVQFDGISTRYPKDRFIIVTRDKVQFRDYRIFGYIPIDQLDFKDQIMHSFDVDNKTAQILMTYYETIPNLIQKIQTNEFSPEALLGQDYHHSYNLTYSDKLILYQLCINGKVQGKNQSQTLQDFGTLFFEGSYYWINHQSRLNYQLHSGMICKPSLMSKKLKKRMIKKQHEERIKAEQQAQAMRQEQQKKRQQAQEKAQKIKKRAQQV